MANHHRAIQGIYTEYYYKENGEFDYVSQHGYREGYEKQERDDGGRTSTEAYSYNNAYINQSYRYIYDMDNRGVVIPDNRVKEIWLHKDLKTEDVFEELEYSYDELGRITKKRLKGRNSISMSSEYFRETYSYKPRNGLNNCNETVPEGSTNYLSSIQYRCGSISGTEFVDYDKNGNISRIQEGSKVVTYEYDGLNRLIGEENGFIGKKYFYSYDADGNLKEVCTRGYNSASWEKRAVYSYASGNVNELLKITEHNLTNNTSREIEIGSNYDGLGNPQSYRGKELTWSRGRVLSRYGSTIYKYDGSNNRIEKETGGKKHEYYTSGGKIFGEKITEGTTVTQYRYVYEGENKSCKRGMVIITDNRKVASTRRINVIVFL